MSATASEADFDVVRRVTDHQPNKEELLERYRQWVHTYEEDLEKLGYNGPILGAIYFDEFVKKYNMCRNMKILDVGAGKGAVAKLLIGKYGFSNLDAVDGSKEMLDKAEELGVYNKCIHTWIGGEHKMPLADNSYDSAIAVGAFGPGHIPMDGFLELIRVVKLGGLIVSVMRNEYTFPGKAFEKFVDFTADLEEKGVWERLADIIPTDMTFYLNYEARVSVFRVK